jgi:hypothetical protein
MYLSEVLTYIARSVGSEKEAWKVLHACLRRGELSGTAETWGPAERWKAIKENREPVQIPAVAWECPALDESRKNTVYWPKQWPEPGMVHYEDDDEYAHGVHFAREDVERLWPGSQSNTIGEDPEVLRAARSSRGAKSMIDWEKVLIEAACYMYAKQEAGSQTELFAHLRTWLNRSDGGPGDTTLKDHIGPLWRAFQKIDSG